jgi:transcriptional regulator with XRE-family HTH domain
MQPHQQADFLFVELLISDALHQRVVQSRLRTCERQLGVGRRNHHFDRLGLARDRDDVDLLARLDGVARDRIQHRGRHLRADAAAAIALAAGNADRGNGVGVGESADRRQLLPPQRFAATDRERVQVRATQTEGSHLANELRVVSVAFREQKALANKAGITEETLSRILNDVTKDPGFETIAKIARAAMLDMNRVIAETADDTPPAVASSLVADLLTLRDRRRLTDFATFLLERFSIAPTQEEVLEFVPFRPREVHDVEEGEYRFPIPPDQFKERDFDYPQPFHFWEREEPIEELPSMAAGPRGVDNPHFLNPRGANIREVLDRVNQIIRVIGDSMEDRYFDGDLVRVDTRNRNPKRGDPIAVYCDELGGSLVGFFKPEGDRVCLVKKNRPKYDDVQLPAKGWFLLGPVVELVRRIERRERL